MIKAGMKIEGIIRERYYFKDRYWISCNTLFSDPIGQIKQDGISRDSQICSSVEILITRRSTSINLIEF